MSQAVPLRGFTFTFALIPKVVAVRNSFALAKTGNGLYFTATMHCIIGIIMMQQPRHLQVAWFSSKSGLDFVIQKKKKAVSKSGSKKCVTFLRIANHEQKKVINT